MFASHSVQSFVPRDCIVESMSAMKDHQDAELLSEFVSESLQGLQNIEQDLLSLETDGGTDKELVNRVFRAVHTIKGNGSYLGLTNLVGVSHKAETLLDRVRAGQQEATPQVTDAVLAAVDSLTTMLQQESLGSDFDCEQVIGKLETCLHKDKSATPGNGASSKAKPEVTQKNSIDPQLTAALAKWSGKDPVFRLLFDVEAIHNHVDVKEGIATAMSSLGKILFSSASIEELDQLKDGQVTFYFETVIDEGMIADHFNIPPDRITKFKVAELKTVREILRESNASVGPVSSPSKTSPASDREETSNASDVATPAKPAANVVPAKVATSSPAAAIKAATTASTADQTMRVPVHILHELLEWTGTMVMARNQLMNEYNFNNSTAFRTLSQAISGVHETVIETRMQTTGSLFERYRRVVRDLSRQLKKEVAFHIEGGDLELDRTILESFADPLTHLIRNCLDHALETPEERESCNKNRQGNVYLRSYVQSGEIILEVEDDGRGICAKRVCEKAVSKAVITPAEAEEMTDDQKIMLIFKPGFSTKDVATDVSGRGVGMDVVRHNIEQVGGTIDVRTVVGQGSTFSARLPLAKALVSSSLTKALVFSIDNERFAIPETAVSEIIRCDEKTRASIVPVDGSLVYQLRDKLVAIVDLREALGMDKMGAKKSASTPNSNTDPDNSCLVVLQFRKDRFGAIVDNIHGIQEIIVRSNPKMLCNCPVYSGHTVLGNGRVSLILDINGIVNTLKLRFFDQVPATAKQSNSAAKDSLATAQSKKRKMAMQKMVIFNYASKEFFAIPLELVAIIERIKMSELKMVGSKEFCQIKNETISTIRLSDFLPISPIDADRTDCCLIRPAAVSYPIGLLTGQDVTIIDVEENFETRIDDAKGIVGSFMHNDRLVMLLDLFSVFEQHAPDKLKSKETKTGKANILIAEDSLFFRKLIAQYIQNEDWSIEVVNDGLEAWERLQSEPQRFDLIISDINMPRMDGFAFATHVRDDRRFDYLPMVALTTLSDDHFMQKGLSVGFDRYVIKIDKRQIRSTVAECLQIKRQAKKGGE